MHIYHIKLFKVLESVFEGSIVLLCHVHVLRYFKEKVFTGKAYWGKAGDKNYLSGAEKEELMKEIILVRDSPSTGCVKKVFFLKLNISPLALVKIIMIKTGNLVLFGESLPIIRIFQHLGPILQNGKQYATL